LILIILFLANAVNGQEILTLDIQGAMLSILMMVVGNIQSMIFEIG